MNAPTATQPPIQTKLTTPIHPGAAASVGEGAAPASSCTAVSAPRSAPPDAGSERSPVEGDASEGSDGSAAASTGSSGVAAASMPAFIRPFSIMDQTLAGAGIEMGTSRRTSTMTHRAMNVALGSRCRNSARTMSTTTIMAEP